MFDTARLLLAASLLLASTAFAQEQSAAANSYTQSTQTQAGAGMLGLSGTASPSPQGGLVLPQGAVTSRDNSIALSSYLLINNGSGGTLNYNAGATLNESNSLLNHSGWLAFNQASFSPPFTVRATENVVLRFVSEYPADAMILTAAEAAKFQYGLKAKGYASFEKQIGTRTAKLSPGTYYCAVRNRSQVVANSFRCELDRQLAPGKSSSYLDTPIQEARHLSGADIHFKKFSVQSGFRYFLDGCALGLDSYVIAESELQKFKNGESFRYELAGSSDQDPGLWELQLAPGNYYLCFENWGDSSLPFTYTLERWRGRTVQLTLSGSHSWKNLGNLVELRVGAITNPTSANSGFLRLRLWATKTPYNGGAFQGTLLAARTLDPLTKGGRYLNLVQRLALTKPARGKYYITLALEEYSGTAWVQRDFYKFSGTASF